MNCSRNLLLLFAAFASALIPTAAGLRVNSAQKKLGSATNTLPAFSGVALVVHCRAALEICEQRVAMVEGYEKNFDKVLYMVKGKDSILPEWADVDCRDPGDPYQCLAQLMKTTLARSKGIFYMHFDAIVDTCELQKMFDSSHFGAFNRNAYQNHSIKQLNDCSCNGNFSGCETGCSWYWWGADTGARWQKTMTHVKLAFPEHANVIGTDHCIHGIHDQFYVSQSMFSNYIKLAEIFARYNIFHEMAGPTMLKLAAAFSNTPETDMQCEGSCMVDVSERLLDPRHSLTCAHKVDLQNPEVGDAIQKIQELPCDARTRLIPNVLTKMISARCANQSRQE